MPALSALSDDDLAAVDAAYGLGVRACRPLWAGTINSNFDLDTDSGRVFLRINEGKSREEVAYEAALLEHLAAAGVPSPLPLRTLGGGNRWADLGGRLLTLFPWVLGAHIDPAGPEQTRPLGRALAAMHLCHRNLNGLVISGVQTGEAFARQPLALTIGCENPTAVPRLALHFACDGASGAVEALEARGRGLVTLQLPTERRGILRPSRIAVSTRFPFGLFRAWSWLHLPLEAVVYPRSAGDQPPPATRGPDHAGLDLKQRGDEDFRGFRSYHPGDSPRHIAWKALARGSPLLVKDHAGASGTPIVFELDQVADRDLERRLSQLARWILDAEQRARAFGLRLPGNGIAPASGTRQRRRCLTALALFEQAH